MSKQHYTLSEEEKQVIRKNSRKIIRAISRKLEKERIILRKRVVCDCKKLIIAVFLYIVEELSFRRLANYMSYRYGIRMTSTAWRKQFYKLSTALLQVTKDYIADITNKAAGMNRESYALDATVLPAQGHSGTAAVVHSVVSLDDGICRFQEVTDVHRAESVSNFPIQSGKLYLADRAYRRASQLAFMYQHNADFLFRFSPAHVCLFKDSDCIQRLDFEGLLHDDAFSVTCYISYQKKSYPVRIIGSLLPEEMQHGAEKRVRRKARKNRTHIQQTTLIHSKWFFLVTSLMDNPADELISFYRQRWSIELFFKRAKTLLRFHKLHRASQHYFLAISRLWAAISLLLSAIQFSVRSRLFHYSLFFSFDLAKLSLA